MVYEQAYNFVGTKTIGATSVKISQKQERKVIYLRNTSTAAQVISIAFDNINPAVANSGIVLAPGEYILDSSSEGYTAWNGDISAISSAAGGTLAMMESPK
jgi:hypothetical protein